ncbi:hypothetical protein CgunFtcFv8_000356 [Champsocephalus gunnari]|uniref:Uncharacterized protein n=1 Tax=Champsocephalus gunnari TaxID=52237 RepID=A0AAN8HPS0_CHAGU|nr:hypothetical protein CgunFtcFv8_000356 [Champsocephalus gunnari]
MEMQLDVNGRISLAPPSQVGMATPLSEHHRDGQEQQELNDAKDQGNLNCINTIMASKGCWGQELQEVKKTQLAQVLVKTQSPKTHLACVSNMVLTRSDFWSLGLANDMDGMILNSCLKVIEKRVDGMFAANSHVIAAWFPPSSLNPMQHLTENAANLKWLLLPVWEPGHCILCPGHWASLGVDDVQDLPRQGFSNNCGVFVLMYAFYIVARAQFDFNESEQQRSQDCKRRREEKAMQDEEVPQKKQAII